MDKLRIGMVGMGFIADWHYDGFQANPKAEIVGMTRNYYGDDQQQTEQKSRLKAKCQEWDIQAYENFDEMVGSPDIDAMIIGSINPYHYEQIKRGIENGKHMLVEKPVVTDFDQLDDIENLIKEKNVKIFPAHNFVYRGAVQQAKELIDAGKLGQIIHASFIITHTIGEDHATGWRAVEELGKGGTLIDSGHHLIYQTLYLLGKPEKIQGFTSKMVLKNMDCEDTAQVNMKYPDGSMAVVMQSWTSDHADGINGIRIFGTEGSLVITDGLYFEGKKMSTDVEYPDSFENQAQAFTDYIIDDVPPLSSLEDVRNTLKITYGTYESNDENVIVKL